MHLFGERFYEDKFKKWSGNRTLVVSVDIGATQSAVAVALLDKGNEPVIINIARWPGQEDHIYEAKVPTVVLYDRDTHVVACGAKALSQYENSADPQGLTLVKNFKLHLHPNALIQTNNLTLEALPLNVRLEDVYTDFMKYALNHTREHLKADIGRDHWTSNTEFIILLAHPNGWGMHEQDFLQRVARSAILFPDDTEPTHQIHFVEEGEASARYCLSKTAGPFGSQLRRSSRFVVCDAGGSTVDISAYEIKSMLSNRTNLEQLGVSRCVGAGGIAIDQALRQYLVTLLASRGYSPEEIRDFVRDGIKDFQKHGKRVFTSDERGISVKIAGRNVENNALQIANGVIEIPGKDVQNFFSPCVQSMVERLTTQLKPGTKHIVLTGGLGESPYVMKCLRDKFQAQFDIVKANSPNSKAVAVGALLLNLSGKYAAHFQHTSKEHREAGGSLRYQAPTRYRRSVRLSRAIAVPLR